MISLLSDDRVLKYLVFPGLLLDCFRMIVSFEVNRQQIEDRRFEPRTSQWFQYYKTGLLTVIYLIPRRIFSRLDLDLITICGAKALIAIQNITKKVKIRKDMLAST